MKNRILLVVFLIAAVFTVNAQKFVPSFYFGTSITGYSGNTDKYCDFLQSDMESYWADPNEGGYSIYLDYPFDTRSRWGLFNTGFALEYKPLKWLSVQAGLEYAPRGIVYKGKSTVEGIDMGFNETWKVKYLDFPTMLKFSTRLSEYSDTRGYLCFGVAPSVLLSAKYRYFIWMDETDFDDPITKGPLEDIIPSGIAKSDFNILYGFGFDFKDQYLEFKFEKGTKNVTEDVNFVGYYGDRVSGLDFKNIMVNISWGFKLNKKTN